MSHNFNKAFFTGLLTSVCPTFINNHSLKEESLGLSTIFLDRSKNQSEGPYDRIFTTPFRIPTVPNQNITLAISYLTKRKLGNDKPPLYAFSFIIEVGFKAGAHGVLGRRCRRDMVQDGVRELPWDERGIVGLLAGKIPACCDDDDDYNSAITPNEPIDSLSMGDEYLNTIQSCSDEDVPEKIFLNPLFKEEIIPMKIDQHHFNAESDLIESLLNHDSSIIPSSLKIDSLFGEFAGELTLLKSISLRIDETDCDLEGDIRLIERLLYDNSSPHPPEEFVSENYDADIESFSPSPIPIEDSDSFMKKIDLTFSPDDPMPPAIKEDDDDSERDILIYEELLDNHSLSLPVIESYYFDIPSFSRPSTNPPDDNIEYQNDG
uniref:Reverse transcriptase domain-containing protein n=1 Tax=Tanacetum cinerariifolium TaxID=118510 RepID=A0A6L2M4E3_TANCI|nr:hypothetical protein [Tanacetum cinerariifolium]